MIDIMNLNLKMSKKVLICHRSQESESEDVKRSSYMSSIPGRNQIYRKRGSETFLTSATVEGHDYGTANIVAIILK
ncbi:hypothetical protein AB6A40_003958 [Gnathostoma spinigerum]|uniref:Uncharacterized protein n=1 Tax=Gnathostoma spinigerum TaxID=75299 RepID=A0ABD6EB19_9BILA